MFQKNSSSHRILVLLLAFVLIVAMAIPGTLAFADEVEVIPDSEPTADLVFEVGEIPDFVFIEFSELPLLETQNIVVALPEHSETVASAELTLVNLYTNQQILLQAEMIADNAILFTCV